MDGVGSHRNQVPRHRPGADRMHPGPTVRSVPGAARLQCDPAPDALNPRTSTGCRRHPRSPRPDPPLPPATRTYRPRDTPCTSVLVWYKPQRRNQTRTDSTTSLAPKAPDRRQWPGLVWPSAACFTDAARCRFTARRLNPSPSHSLIVSETGASEHACGVGNRSRNSA